MTTSRVAALGCAALAFAACSAPPEGTEAPPAVVAGDTVDPLTLPVRQLRLEPVDGSGIVGQAMVTPRAGRTDVLLMIRDAPPEASLGARMHRGSCEAPEEVVAGLSAIRTGADGMGESGTDVGHPPLQVMDGRHVLAVYAPGTEPGRDPPAACGVLPPARD